MLSKMKDLLMAQVVAPWMLIDPPAIRLPIRAVAQHRPEEMSTLRHGRWHLKDAELQPERLIVNCSVDDGRSTSVICIDVKERVTLYANWNELFGKQYYGSGAIGVMLFGIPGLVMTAPISIAAGIAALTVRSLTGVDWHMLSLYWKLRKQLAPHDAGIVKDAMRNHFNGVEVSYMRSLLEKERLQTKLELKLLRAQLRSQSTGPKGDRILGG